MSTTRIEIILGCMYSGKSTELIRRCRRYEAIDKNVLLINSILDTRTGNYIQTHEKDKMKAIKTNLLNDIDIDLISRHDVIAIDEAQFFNDLYEFVTKIEILDKIIIISGLDGDSDRKPFGQILQCIPLCDEVIKLTAMDMIDKDGTPAIFTKRTVDISDIVLVGSTNYFAAVSRKNYFKIN